MKLYKIILNIEMWKNEINEMRSVVSKQRRTKILKRKRVS